MKRKLKRRSTGLPVEAMSIREARAKIYAERDSGIDCPCCGQRCKVYRRVITDKMALTLLAHHALFDTGWGDLNASKRKLKRPSNDTAFLALWHLFEPKIDRDGNRVASQWRVTELGECWLAEQTSVAKYADVFLGRLLRLHGPQWGIHDALGEGFDLDKLLAA